MHVVAGGLVPLARPSPILLPMFVACRGAGRSGSHRSAEYLPMGGRERAHLSVGLTSINMNIIIYTIGGEI